MDGTNLFHVFALRMWDMLDWEGRRVVLTRAFSIEALTEDQLKEVLPHLSALKMAKTSAQCIYARNAIAKQLVAFGPFEEAEARARLYAGGNFHEVMLAIEKLDLRVQQLLF